MAFLDSLWPTILQAAQMTGVDPRIIGAQATLESGGGQHAPGNNLFGIKGGNGPALATTEVVNGQPVRTTARFRGYASPQDSIMGYANFINSNPRYRPLKNAQGLDAQIQELGKSGYATDPNYADKIRSIAVNLPAPLSPEAQNFVNNNPQPGGYGPGIYDPNSPSVFGSMAPTATPPAPSYAGIPPDVANYATRDDNQKTPLQRLSAALMKFPDGPQAHSSMPQPQATNGDALLKYMSNPNPFTDFIKKFRYQGIG